MTTHRNRILLAAGGLLLAAAPLRAQQDASVRIDEHWRAYLGCWASQSAGMNGPMVCVVPTSAAPTVEFMTVVRDSIVSRVPVTVSDAPVAVTRNGCSGTETARWSADERRLYTRATYTCADGTEQRASGILSMTQADGFSRIEGLRTRSGTQARVVNFIYLTDSTTVPREIVRRLPSMTSMPAYAARVEAAAEVTTADIVDASKSLDSSLVVAWLADRGQRFGITARDLKAMHSSGVPDGVIDMIVAVSHPESFQLEQGGGASKRPPVQFGRQSGASLSDLAALSDLQQRQYYARAQRSYGYWDNAWSWGDVYYPWFGFGFNSYYSTRSWGLFGPYYSGVTYGLGNQGWVYGGAPVIIVPSAPKSDEPPGRVINGRGYSQGGSSSGGHAEPRSPSAGSSGGSTGGSSASVGSSSSGGGSSSSGGSTRTAKPRP